MVDLNKISLEEVKDYFENFKENYSEELLSKIADNFWTEFSRRKTNGRI